MSAASVRGTSAKSTRAGSLDINWIDSSRGSTRGSSFPDLFSSASNSSTQAPALALVSEPSQARCGSGGAGRTRSPCGVLCGSAGDSGTRFVWAGASAFSTNDATNMLLAIMSITSSNVRPAIGRPDTPFSTMPGTAVRLSPRTVVVSAPSATSWITTTCSADSPKPSSCEANLRPSSATAVCSNAKGTAVSSPSSLSVRGRSRMVACAVSSRNSSVSGRTLRHCCSSVSARSNCPPSTCLPWTSNSTAPSARPSAL